MSAKYILKIEFVLHPKEIMSWHDISSILLSDLFIKEKAEIFKHRSVLLSKIKINKLILRVNSN